MLLITVSISLIKELKSMVYWVEFFKIHEAQRFEKFNKVKCPNNGKRYNLTWHFQM